MNLDHFNIRKEDLKYFNSDGDKIWCGEHVIADFWGVDNVIPPKLWQEYIEEAVKAAGANILHLKIHKFEGGGSGSTGVAILSESHISFHEFPEIGHISIDIMMCGSSKPLNALDVLKKYIQPSNSEVFVLKRGAVESFNIVD